MLRVRERIGGRRLGTAEKGPDEFGDMLEFEFL
jgi:hypothetical protein